MLSRNDAFRRVRRIMSIQTSRKHTLKKSKFSFYLLSVLILWGGLIHAANSEVLWRYRTWSGAGILIEASPYRYSTYSEAAHEGCVNAGKVYGQMICINDAGTGGYCILNQNNDSECSGAYIVTVGPDWKEINNLCTAPEVYNTETGECVNPDTACAVSEIFNLETHRCEPSKPNRKTFGVSLSCPSPSVGK